MFFFGKFKSDINDIAFLKYTMITIKPFKAYLPKKDLAQKTKTRPPTNIYSKQYILNMMNVVNKHPNHLCQLDS